MHPFSPRPDRPLACSSCKKEIRVCYTEVNEEGVIRTSMCADCPELQRRLYGQQNIAGDSSHTTLFTDLVCGVCETTLDQIRRGHPLGCAECYSVFENVILAEMEQAHALHPNVAPIKRPALLHIGRAPGEATKLAPSSELIALKEALQETLSREDYEQAAHLRDRIKALTEGTITPTSSEGEGDSQKEPL